MYDGWSGLTGRLKMRDSLRDVLQREPYPILATKLREQTIMVRFTTKPKPEKRQETTEEFVKRINSQGGKRNGLKKNLKGARR